jgi:PIN domain nuclease of toxin-antitoxin system
VIVLDTHAWLWAVAAPAKLSRSARGALARTDRVGVCTVSVFELTGLALKQRVKLDVPVREWVRAALAPPEFEALALSTEIALDAAQLRFTGDPIDRIIYATARAANARLVTRDERLRAFDPERTLW